MNEDNKMIHEVNDNEITYQANHSNPNGIEFCMIWLKGQRVLKKINPSTKWAIKQVVEGLTGQYISRDDVIVAANRLGLRGTYDTGYNISYDGIRNYYGY